MEIILSVNDGKKEKFYLLQESLTIGRSSKNDIVIDGDGVSNSHGQFYRSTGGVFYKDLNSKNGSFLNGDKIILCRIFIEDMISIEGVVITIDTKRMKKEDREKMSRE